MTNETQAYLSSNEKISSVSIDMKISSEKIKTQIESGLANPLSEGRTPELGVYLHADESITVEKIESILVSPAREAYSEIKRIPKTIEKSIKVGVEAFGCWLNPFDWGKCYKDIYKTVKETIIEEVEYKYEAKAAVYKDVIVPLIQIQQTLVPVKGYFDYKVELDDLSLSFEENKYKVTGIFEVSVRTHVFLDHLPSDITPRGNVEGKMKFKIDNSGFITIQNDGQIEVSKLNSHFEITELLGSSFVIDALDLGSNSLSASDYVLEYVGKEIDEKLNETIQEMLEEETGRINVKENALELANELNKPTSVGNDGYLFPNITKIFISPLKGYTENNENSVQITFGLTFQPFISFDEIPVVSTLAEKDIEFSTEIEANDGINVSMPIKFSYNFLADQLRPILEDFNKQNENEFIAKKFKLENSTIVFTNDSLMQIKVDILKRKKDKKIGIIQFDSDFYLNSIDTMICQKVGNIRVKSSNLTIAFLKGKIKKEIAKSAEENECSSVADDIRKMEKEIDQIINFNTSFGKIVGVIKELSLQDITACPNYLLLKVNLFGDLSFN